MRSAIVGWCACGLLLLAGCAMTPVVSTGPDPARSVDVGDAVQGVRYDPTQVPPPWPRPLREQQRANLKAADVPFMDGDHSTSQLHIHVYLTLRYNGQPVTIPANIGIVDGRMAVLHTHAEDGTVHIEGPIGRTYTLGQFFAVWGVSLEAAKVYHQGVLVPNPTSYTLIDRQALRIEFEAPTAAADGSSR